jgi:predicted alpha/beta hydrolase family esterase
MPDPAPPVRVLSVPGLDNSGPGHWQTLWEETRGDTLRVELGQWARPHRNSWIGRLDQAIQSARTPAVLVAHSLGCIAVAWWAAFAGRLPGNRVIGALLVAPADCDDPDTDPRILPFAPIPLRRLPFPSLLVASRDDPWLRFERAEELAARWGSTMVDVGHSGHINADSALNDWPDGQALLGRLLPDETGPGRATEIRPTGRRVQTLPL